MEEGKVNLQRPGAIRIDSKSMTAQSYKPLQNLKSNFEGVGKSQHRSFVSELCGYYRNSDLYSVQNGLPKLPANLTKTYQKFSKPPI